MKCYLSIIVCVLIYIATPSSYVTSTFSSAWTSSSPTFTRPGTTTGSYYYAAIQVSVSTSGNYGFGSGSSLDTYGYLYDGSFNPSNPSLNLVAQNDDGLGGLQFYISVYLLSGRKYTLVATTHNAGNIGSFTIAALGPNYLSFSLIGTSSTSKLISSSFSRI